ncbi:cupin domain-containing protein [Micromonospora cremea]|uniref:Cupin domain-containing protein n=1 Tax=Micromonospora cremea TaxID=709881 RepID=A0A1N6B640_9ACTN|nr:cupin domain-containing protein [Micromonospora cremea]SIN41869.1 Cupin domain-containing protein [Micromonospora cremea]
MAKDPGSTSAPSVTRTELQRHPASAPGRLIVQTLFEIPVGLASGRHSHPGEEVGFLIRGTVDMEFDDRPTLTIHAGEPLLIPPRTIHNARNVTDDTTTMMLSTYLVEENEPLVTPYP